jgi:hypothetical protein
MPADSIMKLFPHLPAYADLPDEDINDIVFYISTAKRK